MKRVSKACKAIVLHRVDDFAKPPPDERKDAKEPKSPNAGAAKTLTDQMRSATKKALSASGINGAADTAADRNVTHSKNEFKRLGIDIRKEPNMTPLIDGWRKDSVARVTAMADDQLDKIEDILSEGFGRRAESIAKDIERQLDDVSASRAELIARDQVLTLNAKITEFRQVASGIEEYVWTTSNDERVRDEHEALEGETFSWDEGGDPEEGHPGEAINCRCTAFPILPELSGDDAGTDEPTDENE